MLRSRRMDDDDGREALAELCALYWQPLFAFARARGARVEDAADQVQGFFAYLLQSAQTGGAALSSAAPDRGRFRSYLLGAFRHFLSDDRRRAQSLKRGGGVPTITLEAAHEENARIDASSELTPERLYERRWATTLIGHAMQRLRSEYSAMDKTELFDALSPMLDLAGRKGDSALVAAQLGMSPGAVRVALHRLRRRFGALLRYEVAHTADGDDQIDAELSHLIQIFQR